MVISLFYGVFGALNQAEAMMDLNGNLVSDIWEMENPGYGNGLLDSDGDGFTNQDEGIAGTHPGDRTSFLELEVSALSEIEATLQWSGIAGKRYEIQKYHAGSGEWDPVVTVLPAAVDGLRAVVVTRFEGAVYRVVAGDLDQDADGLSAWEESRLGWSDLDSKSSGDPIHLDFVMALRRLEDPEGVQFEGGELLPARSPSREEAVRFLIQASFGPKEESIAEVQSMGFSGWIEDQVAKPASRTRSHLFANDLPISNGLFRQALWRLANITEDQLRHRVAYAWSQIFVVGFAGGSVVNNNALVQAEFYDFFVGDTASNGGLGNYRDLLEEITYSPVMGNYLSHLKNRKSDPAIGRFPDENFAREIMQLFSIGLWELNNDGTRKLDGGEFIPTYGNDTITEMAKVFTGMSHSRSNGATATSFYDSVRGNDYLYPMKVWDEEHEPGPKNIINNVVLDGTQTGEEEVQATLDALSSHDNVAPFISRLLIQRFTSSNPSRDYMSRVTSVWLGQDADSEDQLKNVVEAILLDPEARNVEANDEFRGKVREPFLRYIQMFRAFDYTDPSGRYRTDEFALRGSLGQFPTFAPSVFNFYLPDYVPPGEMREEGLVGPELQIATMTHLIGGDNLTWGAIDRGATFLVPDYSDEVAIAGNPTALVDHLDSLLTGGMLNSATKATIVGSLGGIHSMETRVKVAVHLVTQSMEFTVIK